MIGTSTSATIAGTARAASSVFTVTRTSSLPAAFNARTCAAVAAASAVSVLVIDWTTIGWALPTGTPPTLTVIVVRRMLTGSNIAPLRAARPLENLVLQHDSQLNLVEPQVARHVRPDVRAETGPNANPEGVRVEDAV